MTRRQPEGGTMSQHLNVQDGLSWLLRAFGGRQMRLRRRFGPRNGITFAGSIGSLLAPIPQTRMPSSSRQRVDTTARCTIRTMSDRSSSWSRTSRWSWIQVVVDTRGGTGEIERSSCVLVPRPLRSCGWRIPSGLGSCPSSDPLEADAIQRLVFTNRRRLRRVVISLKMVPGSRDDLHRGRS